MPPGDGGAITHLRASSEAVSMARERAVWVLVVRPVCRSLGDLGAAMSGGKLSGLCPGPVGTFSSTWSKSEESLACREGP